MSRLKKQIEFIKEIDKLKYIFRQSVLVVTAERKTPLNIPACGCNGYAVHRIRGAGQCGSAKVMKLLMIHDLVKSMQATLCLRRGGLPGQKRETKAAERIFNLLPSDQAEEIWQLWREFEEGSTPEALYAASLDRLQPLLLNYYTEGHTWKIPGVTSDKVYERMEPIRKSTPLLWDYVSGLIEDSIKKGYLKR